MEAGYTFFYEDGSDDHLWVVISDPVSYEKDQVVIVCFNSYIEGRPGHDDTCILHPGDHPSITRPTFVNYRRARWIPKDALERLLSYDTIRRRADLQPHILKAVQQGAGESRHIREKFRMLLTKQGIVE
jgi:hypothetical protein